MKSEPITSAQNPKIKEALSLGYKTSVRREKGLFLVEGRREVERCLGAGFKARCIFWCPEISPELPDVDCRIFEVPKALYEKIAYRGGTEGVLAEMEWRELTLANLSERLQPSENAVLRPAPPQAASPLRMPGEARYPGCSSAPLIIVLESVEKPGNLGAVLRSADAAGADALIICDPLTDIYNPNVIRASVGAVFTVPTVCCTSAEAIRWLKDNKIQILTAQLQDSNLYYDQDMKVPTAIVMGTEAAGLTDRWRRAADAHIRIPMLGIEDSLNVSVSAAILLFEAVRQRQK